LALKKAWAVHASSSEAKSKPHTRIVSMPGGVISMIFPQDDATHAISVSDSGIVSPVL
jgi:hypothetical protein